MTETKKIEIFSAGCPLCEETVKLVKDLACPSCEIKIVTMQEKQGMARARELGVRNVPAVAINGKLADCCAGRGPDPATLKGCRFGSVHRLKQDAGNPQ